MEEYVVNRVCVWMTIVALSLVLGPGTVEAQKKKKIKTYRVIRADKVVGRFDMNTARQDGEIFVVSAYYPGTKALHASRPGSPTVRSYAELDGQGYLNRYKRWEKVGKQEPYWFAFVHEKNVRVLHEPDAGGKGKVKVLGPAQQVVPIDGEMPQLAFTALAVLRQEREFSCVGVKPSAWGKGRIIKVGNVPQGDKAAAMDSDPLEEGEQGEKVPFAGPVPTLERWRVDGDCGRFEIYLDGTGEAVRMVAGETNFELLSP
jgi:hypothetical protein